MKPIVRRFVCMCCEIRISMLSTIVTLCPNVNKLKGALIMRSSLAVEILTHTGSAVEV